MKTAKEILDGKIYNRFDLARACEDVMGALDRQDGYFEDGGYLVSWCVGHLIELAEPVWRRGCGHRED